MIALRSRPLVALVGFLGLASLSACGSTTNGLAVDPSHGHAFQRVNSKEKAEGFYRNTTKLVRVPKFVATDGTLVSSSYKGQVAGVKFAGFQVEYFAAGGTAFLADTSSDAPKVHQGKWYVTQSGDTYPELCSQYPSLNSSGSTACFGPDAYLTDNSLLKLYRGDLLKLKHGKYPTRLDGADANASMQTALQSIGAGTPAPFTAN